MTAVRAGAEEAGATAVGEPLRSGRGVRADVVVVPLASALSLVLGALTAYAQGWLPEALGSLANSTGTWAAVAFGCALLARRAPVAALTGAVTLVGLLAGYVIGADLRGSSSSRSLIAFWGLASVTAGPAVGLCAHWVRTGHPKLAPLGAGAFVGILVGEGIYGLRFIADTTHPPYWRAQIIAGIGLLCVLVATRLRAWRPAGGAALVAAVVAIAFVGIYSQDLMTLL